MKPAVAPQPNPTVMPHRDFAPDLLRGAALLLLVLTNVPLILTTVRYTQSGGEVPFTGNLVDDTGAFLFLAVPTMTGMGMFVLAMGPGLMKAATSKSVLSSSYKRFIAMGALGLAHGFFVWWGDILFYYMIAGLVALRFRGYPPKSQALLGSSLVLSPLVLTIPLFVAQLWGLTPAQRQEFESSAEGFLHLQTHALNAYTSGDLLQVLNQRLLDWLAYAQDFFPVGLPQLIGLILVGAGVAKSRSEHSFRPMSFGHHGRNMCWFIGLALVGYIFQLAIQVAPPAGSEWLMSVSLSVQVVVPPAIAVLVYFLFLRHERRLSHALTAKWIANAGRYSLSIYLFTSVVTAALAYAWTLYGGLSFGVVQLISLVILGSGVVAANLLSIFGALGPAERLLRVLSSTSRNRSRSRSRSTEGY